ncbi:hypothetical protein BD310DRAFT_82608 [Dichomitus squalens]|uniref:Uncharacterized protein n=1 Tax=Dichomitus squalens TaxID=114155 RepID=A0A4Q9PJK7_9APHY|nr:hypothetical protein BD310DRAFT_82608 [Dichomitus squalens]
MTTKLPCSMAQRYPIRSTIACHIVMMTTMRTLNSPSRPSKRIGPGKHSIGYALGLDIFKSYSLIHSVLKNPFSSWAISHRSMGQTVSMATSTGLSDSASPGTAANSTTPRHHPSRSTIGTDGPFALVQMRRPWTNASSNGTPTRKCPATETDRH